MRKFSHLYPLDFSPPLSRFLSHFPQPWLHHKQPLATIHDQPPPLAVQENMPHTEAQRPNASVSLFGPLLICLPPLYFTYFLVDNPTPPCLVASRCPDQPKLPLPSPDFLPQLFLKASPTTMKASKPLPILDPQ